MPIFFMVVEHTENISYGEKQKKHKNKKKHNKVYPVV